MKVELQEKLIKKYPKFFEYLKGYQGPILPIHFGFECGDGWYFLLDTLLCEMQTHINNYNNRKEIKNKFWKWFFNYNMILYKLISFSKIGRKFTNKILITFKDFINPKYISITPMQIDILQIKEKFGLLHVYINGGDDAIYGMISLAESLSYGICEECGSTQNVGSTDGWIQIICKNCIQNKSNKHNWKKHEL